MGATLYKEGLEYGEPDYDEVKLLSKNLNMSTLTIEELRKKYIMYRGRNGKLSLQNYLIFYKEYVNLCANDLEIHKSFNAFDKNRDGFLNFTELCTAMAWHTGINRPELVCCEKISPPVPVMRCYQL